MRVNWQEEKELFLKYNHLSIDEMADMRRMPRKKLMFREWTLLKKFPELEKRKLNPSTYKNIDPVTMDSVTKAYRKLIKENNSHIVTIDALTHFPLFRDNPDAQDAIKALLSNSHLNKWYP